MSLITTDSVRYILNLSILSRILILVIQWISNSLITDHTSDAYQNKYRLLLTNNATSIIHLSETYSYIHKALQGFTNWDSQYFLEISLDGYTSERHLAFFPFLPLTIAFIRQLLFENGSFNLKFIMPSNYVSRVIDQSISTNQIESYIKSVLIGVTLNNFLFFPTACISLFILTKLVKNKNDDYAKRVIWWFCFNPASIFFSSCYSESMFAATTFTAMMLIEYKAQQYLIPNNSKNKVDSHSRIDQFKPVSNFNQILSICLPALSFVAMSTATRSNGLVTIGFLWYQALLKYMPILHTDRTGWTIFLHFAALLEVLQDVLVLLMASIISASGFITFQIYSYIRFCLESSYRSASLQIYKRPSWCEQTIPHAYHYVQAKYWDVGLFRYYQAKKLPNFLLAFPITCLVLLGTLGVTKIREDKKRLVYYLHGVLLTIMCGITINVEVITRLLSSSCPIIYWICADLEKRSLFKRRVILLYFISYFVFGSILHSNFYPWT